MRYGIIIVQTIYRSVYNKPANYEVIVLIGSNKTLREIDDLTKGVGHE